MRATILVLPGDGIGPEIVAEAFRALEVLRSSGEIALEVEHADIGGAAYDRTGTPLPDDTLEKAKAADAILLGAVGGPKWDRIERANRPERGILRLRRELGVFANLRPAVMFPQLVAASTLKPEVVAGLDLMIVRELTGGIYFGEPRGIRTVGNEREGFNTLVYSESEIERICRIGFELAQKRRKLLCSVDKANVLETSELWREVAEKCAEDYPDVSLSHMYVDNASMQLVREPKRFDVIVTSNMFGDIISDLASMLEPIHGSAPDIAGKGVANPLATILSAAMMLRYSLQVPEAADRIEEAVSRVLDQGLRTADIESAGCRVVGTVEMGDAVVEALRGA
jgi:3-isopropylmalate dehydrogenase